MTRRVGGAVLALAALGIAGAVAPGAQAAPSVTITSLRLMTADGVRPARPPYRRGRAYSYRVEYRIVSDGTVRVARSATVFDPFGDPVLRVRPSPSRDEPGRYFASGPVRVGRLDTPGTYRIRYAISVRDGSGRDVAGRSLSVRFR